MSESHPPIREGVASYLYDTDPAETQEWLDSLTGLVKAQGADRARYVLLRLLEEANDKHIDIPATLSTDFVNTIPTELEPEFPGNEDIERRYRAYIRWNAAVMVHRAQRPEISVGGHISTYASSASLYEVGFNHFFRGPDHPGGGDQVFIQGHASPGIYSRAFLEGRLDESRLDGFRQEASHAQLGGGLPSYPHPRNMDDFWQFPTVSMGLGPQNAVFQARFNHYLRDRGIKDTSQQHVWAFLGDGEMDEPESRGFASIAAVEGLDNLTFVVNCNLQRLDGPVRGNGKIIQELESFFRGAGWNVIKVVWGRGWDDLLHADHEGALVKLMNETPDGDYQTFKANDGGYVRDNFFGRYPQTKELVKDLSDEDIWKLRRGGHDYRKIYAAYKQAMEHQGRPTVILAHTIKGYGLGPHFEGRNATHQMKKLTLEDLKAFRDHLRIPISDEELEKNPKLPPYYKPSDDSEEIVYLRECRKKLGGYIPQRRTSSRPLTTPDVGVHKAVLKGSGHQKVATTMALVRIFKELLRDKEIGHRIVPIIPDEARTFGMDSWFPSLKIYNRHGQKYTAVDADMMLAYKEDTSGQILHEGINEAGASASFIAAGTSYSTHNEPMIPLYIFYSMFGFQRTGDNLWAAGDQLTNGFLIGATAGRTTLTGEGLQHADGHSHLLAATNPAAVSYDPAFGYELAHIITDGLKRMYGENKEKIYYYITVYNEPLEQPAEPEDLDVDSLLKGMYLYKEFIASSENHDLTAKILASGVTLYSALTAAQELKDKFNVNTLVYSVTSWVELHRDAVRKERDQLHHPQEDNQPTHVQKMLQGIPGPTVAASEYQSAVQGLITSQVPGTYITLGTDGFGISDTRPAARRHFNVDAASIVVATLLGLAQENKISYETAYKAAEDYRVTDTSFAPASLSASLSDNKESHE